MSAKQKAIIVCGPTASGKSELADEVSESFGATGSGRAQVVVVDSMQVYQEIPVITNQARRLPAQLVGVASVAEEWNVARHKERAEKIIEALPSDVPFVLDAGTGMYLNATILDVPLAPKVAPEVRRRAQEVVAGEDNPRRAARRMELEMSGSPLPGSIWDGELLFDADVIYLRPPKHALEDAIERRSRTIAENGLEEAAHLIHLAEQGTPPNPSVRDAIGVRELTQHLRGELSLQQAREDIQSRTRKLARRQMRWFDKLCDTLSGRARIVVARSPEDPDSKQYVHGIMKA